MSHTAHIPSHRKPRRSASKLSLRAGVAGGVLSTIAVAGAAGPANAEPVTETIEMPTLNADLSADLSSAVAASAEATQQIALDQELQAQEDAAAVKAAKDAKTAKAEAERKAEAEEARRKAEAKAQAEAAERASRSSERTTLSASVGSSDDDSDGGGSSYDSSQATGSAAAIVAFARAQVGDAYVMGSTGPNSWDCSGLVQAAYRQAGIELPRVSGDQSSRGTSVSLDNLQPGDILYWGSRSNSYHVAIYVGGGMFVGAQNPSTGVVERSLDYDMPSGAVRVL
ncbi:glycoside hydrolase [Streptomyces sp. CB03234]|uniref:C40 family peptidase n=1 Tax=Streptomyces sp. (strain CB03234) TaxID=1703937 RepID=UPI00093E0126|nr:C40 family peptidase [Streptomyces sp. CB03234]OKK05871.1 glycoside hydrolase [Streptomyces sp. CB03234]